MQDAYSGLFGPSAQQIQQAQQQQLQQRGDQLAQMNPYARAGSMLYSGAGGLMGLAAEKMGGVNPQVQQAEKIRTLMNDQSIDTGTSEGLMVLAQKLHAVGMTDKAFIVVQKANEMKRQEASGILAARKQALAETKEDRQSELDREVRTGQLELQRETRMGTLEVQRQTLEQRANEAKQRSEDTRLSIEQRAESARLAAEARKDANTTRQMIAQMASKGGINTPPKNLTREARLAWELENGMIDQATYDAAISASPGGVLRQKQTDAASGARTGFDAVKRNIDQLYDVKTGKLKPSAQSLFGQYAQYRPEVSLPQEAVDAKLALEGLTDQVMMANLADAKSRVGQSFGSMQVQEWDKFTQQLTSLKRGLSEDQAAKSMKYILKFIKDKGDLLETALSRTNTITPVQQVVPTAPNQRRTKSGIVYTVD